MESDENRGVFERLKMTLADLDGHVIRICGAFLLKPLRTNELLNLWTHMWRRWGMLGLAEKNLLNYAFDLVASDLSDPNTKSATLLSDDTNEKFRKIPSSEMGLSKHQEDELLLEKLVCVATCWHSYITLHCPSSSCNLPQLCGP